MPGSGMLLGSVEIRTPGSHIRLRYASASAWVVVVTASSRMVHAAQREVELGRVGVERQVFLADLYDVGRGLAGDVHVESGAGADDDVGIQFGEEFADSPVRQSAVLVMPVVAAGEVVGGELEFRVFAVVSGALLVGVDEMPEVYAFVIGEAGDFAMPKDGHHLHLVTQLGKRA